MSILLSGLIRAAIGRSRNTENSDRTTRRLGFIEQVVNLSRNLVISDGDLEAEVPHDDEIVWEGKVAGLFRGGV